MLKELSTFIRSNIATCEEVQIVQTDDIGIVHFRVKLSRALYNMSSLEFKGYTYSVSEIETRSCKTQWLFSRVDKTNELGVVDNKIVRKSPDIKSKSQESKILYIPGRLIRRLCLYDEDGLHKYIKKQCPNYTYEPTPIKPLF